MQQKTLASELRPFLTYRKDANESLRRFNHGDHIYIFNGTELSVDICQKIKYEHHCEDASIARSRYKDDHGLVDDVIEDRPWWADWGLTNGEGLSLSASRKPDR